MKLVLRTRGESLNYFLWAAEFSKEAVLAEATAIPTFHLEYRIMLPAYSDY